MAIGLPKNFDLQGFQQMLEKQMSDLQLASGPQFGDTAGAFAKMKGAATTGQAQATKKSQAEQLEQAAAQGKTFSSSQTAAQNRIDQEGQNQLSMILGQLGLQEQEVLGQQAAQTSAFEKERTGQVTDLMALLGQLSQMGGEEPTAPVPQAGPAPQIMKMIGGGGGGAGGSEKANPFLAMLQKALGPSMSDMLGPTQGFGIGSGAKDPFGKQMAASAKNNKIQQLLQAFAAAGG